ncbi:signal recognition particle, SRP9/SRP14 subunit [Schizophyllum commune Tattone D]|nr:signal recognition particle, SRP9/SRP14 subunit [Schizophyllum commune Tattone D]
MGEGDDSARSPLVDNDKFLKDLAVLFESPKGSIWLTHKRLTHDGQDTTMKADDGSEDTREYPCLLRAVDGVGTKLSTRVEPGHLDRFYTAYGALLKSSMSALRKRDKKREKQRAEELARRKKRLAEPVVVEGAKRGAGRRKRQRLVKAAIKQQETKKRLEEREQGRTKRIEELVHAQ